jgi:hypothetical protein
MINSCCQFPSLLANLMPRMISAGMFAFLWAMVKYLVGVAFALATIKNHFLGFVFTSFGAMVGIVIFTYGGLWMNNMSKRILPNGKKFNKRNRMLIRIKHSGGLPLVALLTPAVLSIPVGCILATTFIHDRRRIVLWMWAAVLLYGVVIFGALWIFNINLAERLQTW